ncbi:hypothetical protein [Pseudorhodoferax sp. Leaf274]|uniref:hypothetical protein n=1 Tax=Pseudorhodoferax sp. Leaf274 TaxID=1736318 RepID=UPI0007030289|nr:hypothetical protein [Pseudorhodoferax sp. Leaf274]KQP36346.1 hypothetical protein ASF44_17510 [Pseudorhodoferax sp. Leaf274]
MNKPPVPTAGPADLDAMQAALAGTAERLHHIVSRTESVRIAAEVLRLNDAVQTAVEPHLPCSDPPGAYLHALVALADSTNGVAA